VLFKKNLLKFNKIKLLNKSIRKEQVLKDKPKINYFIDVLMLVCFLIAAISGIYFLFIGGGPGAGCAKLERFLGETCEIFTQFLAFQ
jgi:hypothetical protein